MSGPEDLDLLAHDLLDACVAALDTIPNLVPGAGGSPARAFVSPGAPVFDWAQPSITGEGCCDQLTVYANTITDAPLAPGGLAAGKKRNWITHVGLVVTITRCVPMSDGLPPAVEDEEFSAMQINADGWALWNYLQGLIHAGDLLPQCAEVFFDGMRSISPSGGCGGWTLNFRAELDGYSAP